MHKVITLKQPWATLVVIGAKRNETRSWSTRYRGELLIHSSAKVPPLGFELSYELPFRRYINPGKDLLTGFILGSVTLVDVLPVEGVVKKIGSEERAFGDYTPGRFAWILENPVRFKEPIPATGSLSIWEYKQDLQLQTASL